MTEGKASRRSFSIRGTAVPRLTRRRVLQWGVALTGLPIGALLLQACGTATTATPRPTTAASAATPKPTAATVRPTAAATTTAGVQPATLKNVPRNRTLVLTGVPEAPNQFTGDVAMQNPFLPGITRSGFQVMMEPLYFYNSYYTDKVCGPPGMACTDGEIPWLATSYQYNSDSTEILVKLRKGVTWSDGQPFTAKDVVFTVNMLKENAPKLTWSVDMKTWVKDIVAPDDYTVKFTLTAPNPHFFFDHFQFHEDIGVQIVPEHVFNGQDPLKFSNFDLAKGWPVVTGPYRLVHSDSQQKIWDRRADWWAAKTGFHPLPAPERLVFQPGYDSTKQVELLIANAADTSFLLTTGDVQSAIQRNPKLQSWTGDKPPYGCVDYWTPALGFNDAKPPYNDPDIRWAINYAINRDEILKIAYKGGGQSALVPYAAFPALQPYIDSVSDLLRTYPVGTTDLAKSAQIMQSKGYAKDSSGLWAKDGKRLPLATITFSLFEDIAPLVAAQLRKAGFDAAFKMPANFGTLISTGQAEGYIWGGNASVRSPYATLKLYQAKRSPFYWENKTFDGIVTQMAVTTRTDPKLKTLLHQAMSIWLKELPAIPLVQLYERTPFNTTYWTGWPDQHNPYINTIFIHRTFLLIVNSLKPAQG